MKKKVILLALLGFFFLVGCTPVQDMSLDDIINNGTNRVVEVYNKYRKGYKYNCPKGLDVIKSTEYNEVIASKDYKYFLYVDAVSYYNKIIENYEVNDNAFVSKQISYEDKYGYLEINELENEKYFIEIMYNYAKIEVIVKKKDINVVVANCLSVLSSINFNENVLKTLLDEEVSQFREFEFNIFETTTTVNSSYLEAVKEEEKINDEVHDSDLIN